MKKIIFTLFILFNFLANAQVTFKPGVKAGITLSKFTGIIEQDKNNFNFCKYFIYRLLCFLFCCYFRD